MIIPPQSLHEHTPTIHLTTSNCHNLEQDLVTMTASTPRSLSNDPSSFLFDNPTSSTASMNQTSVHRNPFTLGQMQRPHCPPSLPSPCAGYDIPDELALPILAPRATKQRRRELDETSATLMDFVSHMSLDDVRSAAHSYRASFTDPSPAFSLKREEPSATSNSNNGRGLDGGDATKLRALSSTQKVTAASWSLTTPETMKSTISTPQFLRLGSQKRKSPTQQVHCTPVDGNRPLLLPSLTTVTSRMPTASTSTTASQPSLRQTLQGGRCLKKAKNYKNLLSNAPMLPSSPDLEDRERAMAAPHHRFRTPYFSPIGGVTLVNPNFVRQLASSSPTPTPQQAPRRTVPLAATGLPNLDETERSAPKWLRMKRRTSLLCALRLAATES